MLKAHQFFNFELLIKVKFAEFMTSIFHQPKVD